MSSPASFQATLNSREQSANSLLCVGLDPVLEKMPEGIEATPEGVVAFCTEIIRATQDLVSSYKPNLPFYLSLGSEGLTVLRKVREAIPADIPMVLDCKVNDLGDTAEAWARMAFDYLEADAVVVAPYMGEDALAPYFNRPGKGVIVLTKTSNPGSGDLQDAVMADSRPLYMHVAERSQHWNGEYPADIGMVVGATYPDQLATIRKACPDLPILLPGLGAQGGDVEGSVRSGADSNGGSLMCSSSRGILFASNGTDFAEAARKEAMKLRDAINEHRVQSVSA